MPMWRRLRRVGRNCEFSGADAIVYENSELVTPFFINHIPVLYLLLGGRKQTVQRRETQKVQQSDLLTSARSVFHDAAFDRSQ